VTQAGERFYERGRRLWFDYLVQDIRYVLRGLRRASGIAYYVAAVVVGGLAAIVVCHTDLFCL